MEPSTQVEELSLGQFLHSSRREDRGYSYRQCVGLADLWELQKFLFL